MTLFLFFIILLCFWRLKLVKPVCCVFNENYISIERTDSIKGIFILLVFMSHIRNYLAAVPEHTSDSINMLYNIFQDHLGQGVVIMFLFYSGYGVMESIKKKGLDYIHIFPKNRFAKTLLHFDIAVLLFVILDLCLGTLKDYSVLHVLLSFTGWESVGNSNWYIFAVLILYLITYISFKICKDKYSRAAALITFFTVLYIAVLAFFKDAWWFDTVLLYPLGIWYSLGKNKIEDFVRKKPVNYYLLFALCAVVFVVSHLFRRNILFYEISQVSLCAVIVAATMKIDIHNKILQFFGTHLFEIYILMRIPMIVLLHLHITNTYFFVLISFAVTVALAFLFKKVLKFVDGKIFKSVKI